MARQISAVKVSVRTGRHDVRIDAAVGEGSLVRTKLFVADHPAGSQQVVRRQGIDQCVTGRLCLPYTPSGENGSVSLWTTCAPSKT